MDRSKYTIVLTRRDGVWMGSVVEDRSIRVIGATRAATLEGLTDAMERRSKALAAEDRHR